MSKLSRKIMLGIAPVGISSEAISNDANHPPKYWIDLAIRLECEMILRDRAAEGAPLPDTIATLDYGGPFLLVHSGAVHSAKMMLSNADLDVCQRYASKFGLEIVSYPNICPVIVATPERAVEIRKNPPGDFASNSVDAREWINQALDITSQEHSRTDELLAFNVIGMVAGHVIVLREVVEALAKNAAIDRAMHVRRCLAKLGIVSKAYVGPLSGRISQFENDYSSFSFPTPADGTR